jgi:2-polyprenyl-3-methyl-5-hydroxy-6-metoxy-1,4-benzoquinol methylase
LLAFSQEYSVCPECGTLVSQQSLADDQLRVQNDDTDFYGKQYWLDHQKQDLGFPDIHARARNDLPERNLHWLKALLKYCLPPAKVLELGCSSGSFVALLRQAGYDASGVEMSPWVVEFGQKTFGVPISPGPVETLELPPGSLDAIALMDVLEHLPDPAATMAHCLKLLKPDGLLLIQTPQFKEGMDYMVLVETKGAFLEQLKADEHLYLFSDRSVTRLFQQLGAQHFQFEPAIFGHYDMFFAVSRAPLQVNASEQIESALLATPNGRLALALLDMDTRLLDMDTRLLDMDTRMKALQARPIIRIALVFSYIRKRFAGKFLGRDGR